MKLRSRLALALTLALLLVPAMAFSQRRITLSVENETVENVMDRLRRDWGFSLV